MVKTKEEIEDILDQANDLIIEGEDKFPGMSYPEGVKYACECILNYGPNPFSDD